MITLTIVMMLFMGQICPGYDYQVQGVTSVEQALGNIKAAYPDWGASYKVHEFDCSEMSAFVCDYLEACGLEPTLRSGYSKELGYSHAWVECQGHVVECVGLNTVDSFSDWFDYFGQDIECDASEWDWWNSPQIGISDMVARLGGDA